MATIYRDTTQAYNVSTDLYKEVATMWSDVVKALDPIGEWIRDVYGGINNIDLTNAQRQESEQNYYLRSDEMYNKKQRSTLIIIAALIGLAIVLLFKGKENVKK